MIETVNDITSSRADRASHYWHARAMRARLINENDRLRGMARASYTPAERILAAAIAEDLHVEPDTLAPRLAAVSAVTGLRELYDSREARSLGPEPTAGDLILLVNQVIDYTIAGLTAVHADASAVEARLRLNLLRAQSGQLPDDDPRSRQSVGRAGLAARVRSEPSGTGISRSVNQSRVAIMSAASCRAVTVSGNPAATYVAACGAIRSYTLDFSFFASSSRLLSSVTSS
jgi:hypothetical protein